MQSIVSKLLSWSVSIYPDGVSLCPEYHLQPLFFTQQSKTPFWDTTNPTPKHPFSWPELESGQNELLCEQNGPHLGKMFEKWAKLSKSGQKKFVHQNNLCGV